MALEDAVSVQMFLVFEIGCKVLLHSLAHPGQTHEELGGIAAQERIIASRHKLALADVCNHSTLQTMFRTMSHCPLIPQHIVAPAWACCPLPCSVMDS